jgi:hypothetical protein
VSNRTIASLAALAALALTALPGCGSSHQSAVPGGADPQAVQVIKQWVDELRAGDVQAASDRFALPVIVANGTPPLRLTDRQEVVQFNESLPCGAKLTRAVPQGRFVVATFVLTERPGPGECGPGVGQTARTAFVIHDGRIAEWRRVANEAPAEPPSTQPIV